jgi:hypothetical protein
MTFKSEFGSVMGNKSAHGIAWLGTALRDILVWCFSYVFSANKPEAGQTFFQVNKLRSVIWSVLIFVIYGMTSGQLLVSKTTDMQQVPQPRQAEQSQETLQFITQLEFAPLTTHPQFSRYVVHENAQPPIDIRGVSFILYSTLSRTSVTQVTKPGTCVIVPLGEPIHIQSQWRPVYVHNMENQVTYMRRKAWYQELLHRIFVSTLKDTAPLWQRVQTSWQTAHNEYDAVQNDAPLQAQAKSSLVVPDARIGGLVCF